MTQFLGGPHLDGPVRVGGFVIPRKTQPACQIEAMGVFPADGRVSGGRGVRILPVFLSYVSPITPPVPAVRKLRMVLSMVATTWGVVHPNPGIVYTKTC